MRAKCERPTTPKDYFRIWTMVIAGICSAVSAFAFEAIPWSNEKYATQNYSLLAITVCAGVIFFALLLFTTLTGSGDDAKYAETPPLVVVVHVATVLCCIGLIVSTIILVLQIGDLQWPDLKTVQDECQQKLLEENDSDAIWKSDCAALNRTQTTANPEPTDLELCDLLFDMYKVNTGHGKTRRTKIGDAEKYCVTTKDYRYNVATVISAILAVPSYVILQGLIFYLIKTNYEEVNRTEC